MKYKILIKLRYNCRDMGIYEKWYIILKIFILYFELFYDGIIFTSMSACNKSRGSLCILRSHVFALILLISEHKKF